MASTDGDISLSQGKFELAHNFVGKVWNVARFVLGGAGKYEFLELAGASLRVEDRWILGRLARLVSAWTRGLEKLKPSRAADGLYEFVWHTLSDWYVESARLRLQAGGKDADVCYTVLIEVMRRILLLVHPFTPFLSVELWEKFRGVPSQTPFEESIDRALLPPLEWEEDEEANRIMAQLMDIVRAVRTVRAVNRIGAQTRLPVLIRAHDRETAEGMTGQEEFLQNLACASALRVDVEVEKPPGYTVVPSEAGCVYIALGEEGRGPAEGKRLESARRKAEERFISVTRKLESLEFLKGAPPELVAEMKRLKRNLSHQIAALRAAEEERRSVPSVPRPSPEPSGG
jgi:valyl-tRNA synthetase